MRAKLINNVTGEVIEVRATSAHPDSHYGHKVWVDKDDVAYLEVGMRSPFYTVKDVEGSEDDEEDDDELE